ncbi:hypothetical protein EDEG_02438 [Edhazardia aedis USNM 41457]|uniref:Uncharacterized protein n=1 Tax=Edhazardia aedis (strain USNM 41457) TaxID=1003232 RepID=J9DKR8_EDHAE|nr:hypothetical protein EDEG_02438 [Edhazardia aedis USNM 41457]|eukprot:EJW03185.1 hypothetical protein EDEG_02438 [Edhazardia aedis USNM 41457]
MVSDKNFLLYKPNYSSLNLQMRIVFISYRYGYVNFFRLYNKSNLYIFVCYLISIHINDTFLCFRYVFFYFEQKTIFLYIGVFFSIKLIFLVPKAFRALLRLKLCLKLKIGK